MQEVIKKLNNNLIKTIFKATKSIIKTQFQFFKTNIKFPFKSNNNILIVSKIKIKDITANQLIKHKFQNNNHFRTLLFNRDLNPNRKTNNKKIKYKINNNNIIISYKVINNCKKIN